MELSERPAQLTGLGHAFYGSDRASATEIAMKMSAHYWRNIGRARVRHARHLGMIWAWDIDDAPANFARAYFQQAMARGLLLRPIGNTLYAMPPYVLDEEAIDHLGRAALAALDATLAMGTG